MKTAIVKQKHREETGKKEWALVSKSDPSKVLKWFGTAKPSDEAVQKEEARIQFFKHKGGSDMNLRKKTIRLAYENPSLRPHLLPILKEARKDRLVPEKIRAEYFEMPSRQGGATGRWIIRVTGGTFEYKNELKRLGLWWDRQHKRWTLDSGRPIDPYVLLQGWTDFDPSNEDHQKKLDEKNAKVKKRRAQQKKAWPVIQKIVKEHNDKVEELIQAQTKSLKDVKDYTKWRQHNQRLMARLKKHGIEIKYDTLSETGESQVLVKGKTYDIKDVMKKYRFRWNSRERGWALPYDEFRIVSDKWKTDVAHAFAKLYPETPAEDPRAGTAVFSEMSQSEYKRFVEEAADRDYDFEEGYDGEVRIPELKLEYFRKLRNLSPKEQQEAFENFERGFLALPKSDRRYRRRGP